MQPAIPSTTRVVILLAAPFLFVGIGASVVEDQIERGAATPAAFGLLMLLFGLLLAPLANQLEARVFGIAQRPWLRGRLRRWQRLILPYSTASILRLGLGAGFGGAAYLMEAPPGGVALNVLAVALCAAGGALVGFGLSRLAAGILVIRYSGLWAASKRAWSLGAAVVVVGSTASAARAVVTTMSLSPAF